MRKVKLSIESLHVESFETAASGTELRGTVAAHMPKPQTNNCPIEETYYVGNTCECTLELSCAGTCPYIECNPFTAETCETFDVETCP